MRIRLSKPFVKDYQKLPSLVQKKVDKKLKTLMRDFQNPGLGARKQVGSDIWEARVDIHYRMTFKIDEETYTMRRVGTHKIYRKP